MMKAILVVVFAVAICFLVLHFAPSASHSAFKVGQFGITWIMLTFGTACLVGWRTLAK